MNGNMKRMIQGAVRFTGAGALLMAMIGLITTSPVHAGELGAPCGRFEHPGEDQLEFLRIVLDLSDNQTEEIAPMLEEHREMMEELRQDAPRHDHRAVRIDRMHRRDLCDKVDRTELRAQIRRDRREMDERREKMRNRAERERGLLEEKLAKVLDEGQMKKYIALRELRQERMESHRERRELRGERHERMNALRSGAL